MRTELWKQRARTGTGADYGCNCGLSHSQLPPDGEWWTWYLRGGRGSGKTRAGGETLADWILGYCFAPDDDGDWAIVAPTFGDARDTCMEGPSGLLRALRGIVDRKRDWNRSHGELWLPNGTRVYCDGADDGAYRIQGKNLRGAWCDELGLWQHGWAEAWNESLANAVRLEPARIVATGTPKMGHPLVKQVNDDPTIPKHHMRMVDNIANLHPARVEELYLKYRDSRLGRTELEGEFVEEIPGALWTLELIETSRVEEAPPLSRVVIGVDPSGAADEDTGANEIGIVVCGFSSHLQRGFVLADYTMRGGPERWAAEVGRAYDAFGADLIVAERNFGGEMVRSVLTTARSLPVKLVTASRGKDVRAEPVALLYDQGRVHHVGPRLGDLEAQMTTWVPGVSKTSPDRLDALVWALTELMIAGGEATSISYLPDDDELVVRRGDFTWRGPGAERYLDRERDDEWDS